MSDDWGEPTVDALNTSAADDRRRWASEFPLVTGARLVPGGEVELVNISHHGALIRCGTRLAPDSQVTLRLEGSLPGNVVRGRVLRCHVAAIAKNGTLIYQSAVAFDERVELDGVAPAEQAPPRDPPAVPDLEESGPAEAAVENTPPQSTAGESAPAPRLSRPSTVNRW